MKNRKIIIPAIFLIIAVGNYISIADEGSVRAIEFVSIFVIGVFAGIILTQVFKMMESRSQPK